MEEILSTFATGVCMNCGGDIMLLGSNRGSAEWMHLDLDTGVFDLSCPQAPKATPKADSVVECPVT